MSATKEVVTPKLSQRLSDAVKTSDNSSAKTKKRKDTDADARDTTGQPAAKMRKILREITTTQADVTTPVVMTEQQQLNFTALWTRRLEALRDSLTAPCEKLSETQLCIERGYTSITFLSGIKIADEVSGKSISKQSICYVTRGKQILRQYFRDISGPEGWEESAEGQEIAKTLGITAR